MNSRVIDCSITAVLATCGTLLFCIWTHPMTKSKPEPANALLDAAATHERQRYERAVCWPVDRMDITAVERAPATGITSLNAQTGTFANDTSSASPIHVGGNLIFSAVSATVPKRATLTVPTSDVECTYVGTGDSPIKAAEAALSEYRKAHSAPAPSEFRPWGASAVQP